MSMPRPSFTSSFELPAARPTADAPRASSGPRQGGAGEVFVVAIDDSPAVRTIIEYTFARAGARVVTFADGMEALRVLDDGRLGVPDLILLDIGLPGLDGYEVATILRRKDLFLATPIVMLSGHDGIVDRLRSRIVGAQAFVRKPFRARDLVAVVFEQLGRDPPQAPATRSDPHDER